MQGWTPPNRTVDWDISQADNFRDGGVSWTSRRWPRRGRAMRSDRKSQAHVAWLGWADTAPAHPDSIAEFPSQLACELPRCFPAPICRRLHAQPEDEETPHHPPLNSIQPTPHYVRGVG